jgi:hypothetical protein
MTRAKLKKKKCNKRAEPTIYLLVLQFASQ